MLSDFCIICIYIKYMESIIKISIVVLQYNPNLNKLYLTLDSILRQRKILYEIIVADDGSKNNYFVEIEQYLKNKNFFDFRLIHHDKNCGTVKNYYDGVIGSQYDIIKVISPGDMLYGDNVLYKWALYMIEHKCLWSICKVVYHKIENNHIVSFSSISHPKYLKCYLRKCTNKCIINYLIFNDNAVGASFLTNKYILIKYLLIIMNRVEYAEDNIYRLMILDNVPFVYFPFNAIFYEYGTGISTSNNVVFNAKIQSDWENTNAIIANASFTGTFLRKIIIFIYKNKNLKKIIEILFVNKYFMFLFNDLEMINRTDAIEYLLD